MYAGATLTLILLSIFSVVIYKDSVKVSFGNEECDKMVLQTYKTYTKLLCDKVEVARWNEQVYSYTTKWIKQNVTDTKLSVIDSSPEYFVVRKNLTLSDGTLLIDYRFDNDGVKWYYDYVPSTGLKHKISMKFSKFNLSSGLEFSPIDDDYTGLKSGYHVYGEKTGRIFVDPWIHVVSGGNNYWVFTEPFDNSTDINLTRSSNVTVSGGTVHLTEASLTYFIPDLLNDSSLNKSFVAYSNGGTGGISPVFDEKNMYSSSLSYGSEGAGWTQYMNTTFNQTILDQQTLYIVFKWNASSTAGKQSSGALSLGNDTSGRVAFKNINGNEQQTIGHDIYNITYNANNDTAFLYINGTRQSDLTSVPKNPKMYSYQYLASDASVAVSNFSFTDYRLYNTSPAKVTGVVYSVQLNLSADFKKVIPVMIGSII